MWCSYPNIPSGHISGGNTEIASASITVFILFFATNFSNFIQVSLVVSSFPNPGPMTTESMPFDVI